MCGPLNLVDSIFGPVWFSLPLLMCPGAVSQGSGSLPQARPTTCCGRRPVLWLLLVVAAPRPASLPPRQQQQRLASSDLGRGWWSLPQGPERPASRDTRLPPVWPCVALCGPVCCAQFQPRLLAARGQTSPHLPHLVSPLGHTTGNTHTRLPMTFRKRPEGEFATKPSRLVRLERPLVINLDWVPPPLSSPNVYDALRAALPLLKQWEQSSGYKRNWPNVLCCT